MSTSFPLASRLVALAIASLFFAGPSLADNDKGKGNKQGDKQAQKFEKRADKQERKADKQQDKR